MGIKPELLTEFTTILNAVASIKNKNKQDGIFELVIYKHYIQVVIKLSGENVSGV